MAGKPVCIGCGIFGAGVGMDEYLDYSKVSP